MVRAEVRFQGRVQGVGFRFNCLALSRSYDVTGLVRNEEDGSVYLCAEGMRSDIEAFIAAIQEKMTDFVRNTDVQWSQASGRWSSFDIDR